MERVAAVMERAMRAAYGPGARLSDVSNLPRSENSMRRSDVWDARRPVARSGRLDAVAFTQGPGLAGALLVGKVAAQSLALAARLPCIGVNHVEAHALAIGLACRHVFPYLALIASGGHTDLIRVESPGRYRVLGRTRDDAAGEVFDKVAKLLRLAYPGGPAVESLAREGDREAVRFPRPLLPGAWDFSFSGLKTAVLYHVRDSGLKPQYPRRFAADVCASFQEAVVDTLVKKTLAAARRFRMRRVVVGGGVAANRRLRARFAEEAEPEGLRVLFPPAELCTDNAAMIAYAGALRLRWGGRAARRTKHRKCVGLARPEPAPFGCSGRLAVDPSLPIASWGNKSLTAA
ncbi:MAG: tRNA (adenosine(37)-N6)-threonylcarbamoyltransferase complex transferase subunit TsaD [Elusimicrobia bacterium]|nr:tRNA (adenosine(37)-N6)-threonylcarbamoyltransferase complex transferase subunit TsaD [Elusimicrobiota bacterium]